MDKKEDRQNQRFKDLVCCHLTFLLGFYLEWSMNIWLKTINQAYLPVHFPLVSKKNQNCIVGFIII